MEDSKRIGRRQYGRFIVLMMVSWIFGVGLLGAMFRFRGLFVLLVIIGGLASIIATVAMTIYRLNDIGLPRWLVLILLIPSINFIAVMLLIFIPGGMYEDGVATVNKSVRSGTHQTQTYQTQTYQRRTVQSGDGQSRSYHRVTSEPVQTHRQYQRPVVREVETIDMQEDMIKVEPIETNIDTNIDTNVDTNIDTNISANIDTNINTMTAGELAELSGLTEEKPEASWRSGMKWDVSCRFMTYPSGLN